MRSASTLVRSRGRTVLAAAAALAATVPLALAAPAGADEPNGSTEVVTESDATRQAENTPPTDSWVLYTRAGTPPTAGAFTDGPGTPPLGDGSLQLTTTTGAEKVFLFNHDHVGTALGDVDDISYSTHRTAGSADQLAALNLQVDHNGDAPGGFTTLVFEPVYNLDQQGVVDGTWQDWTATGSGTWWSTRPINDQCAGATAACERTWAEIVAANPDAVVVGGVGLNQGSGNPGLTTSVDAFTFDATTYDFERVADSDGDGLPDVEDTDSKDDCKNGGYARFTNPTYRNQGACVSDHVRG